MRDPKNSARAGSGKWSCVPSWAWNCWGRERDVSWSRGRKKEAMVKFRFGSGWFWDALGIEGRMLSLLQEVESGPSMSRAQCCVTTESLLVCQSLWNENAYSLETPVLGTLWELPGWGKEYSAFNTFEAILVGHNHNPCRIPRSSPTCWELSPKLNDVLRSSCLGVKLSKQSQQQVDLQDLPLLRITKLKQKCVNLNLLNI